MRLFTIHDLPLPSAACDFWQEIAKDSRPIVVYGTGNGADKLALYLAERGREIADFFASDGFCRGQSFRGKRVLSFAEIKEKYQEFVILVAFGSTRQEVLSAVYALDAVYDLYVPELPLAENALFDADFYRLHYAEILRAYHLLADDVSRSIFVSIILYRLSAKLYYLKNATYNQDESDILHMAEVKCAVDVGAYRGDTLEKWQKEAKQLSRVYAIEPDPKNFVKLSAVAEIMPFETQLFNAAAFNEDGWVLFSQSGNRNATLVQTGETASYQHKTAQIKAVRIDTVLAGACPDFIKYDTEGAEKEALEGTEATIRNAAPNLLVSAYHKSKDFFSLLLQIEDTFPGIYRFYLRRIECIPGWELNLLAVKP